MNRIIIIISLILIGNSLGFGQEKYKSQRSAKKINLENQIQSDIDSASYYLSIDYNKSFDFIEKGFKVLGKNKNKYRNELGKLYELLGDIYLQLGQYDLANDKYTLATQNYKNVSNSLILKLVDINIELSDYKKVNKLLESLPKSTLTDTTLLEFYKYKGDLFYRENSFESALSEYNNGLEQAHKLKLNPYIILFDNRIASVYSKKGAIEKAEIHLNNSISNVAQQDVQSQIIQAETNAEFYRANNKLDKEINLRKSNILALNKLDKDQNVQKELQYQNLRIADAYIEILNYKTAIPYLEKSKATDEKLSDINIKIQATKKLSEAYEKIGDYDMALTNYKNYVKLTDKQYKEKENEIKDAIKLTNELANKQKRIDVLELDRELNESKEQIYEKDRNIAVLSNNKQRLIIYSLLGGLLLSLIAIFFFYKNNQQRKIANNLLALKALKSQMNPHFIFNALNSVNSFIALNDERKANRYLTDFSMLMRMVLDVSEKDFISLKDEVKLISLYMKLEHLRFKDKFEYTINIDESLSLEKIKIPPMLIQPFIENAVWHGLRYKKSIGNLDVSIVKSDNNNVLISIVDDGIGRQKSLEIKSQNQIKKPSKGMSNTIERIKIINEMYNIYIKLKINDLNGDSTGTIINLILPLKKN